MSQVAVAVGAISPPSAFKSSGVAILFSKLRVDSSDAPAGPSERDVLLMLEQEFKKSGLVNDKRWFLNIYKNVFYGKDMVAWLMSPDAGSFQVSSKADAMAIGMLLLCLVIFY